MPDVEAPFPGIVPSSPQYDTSKSRRGFEASNVPQSIFVPCSFMVHSIAGVGHLLMRSDQISTLLSINRQDKFLYTFRRRNRIQTLTHFPPNNRLKKFGASRLSAALLGLISFEADVS